MKTDWHLKNSSWTRRETLKLALAAGVFGSGLTSLALWAEPAKELQLVKRKIPGSGELIPIIGMGSSGSFETARGADLKAQREVLELFVKLGGCLLDTSPTYGNAETNIGKLADATGVRKRLFMATKVHQQGREQGVSQMQGSESHLGKPLDLIQVHNLIDVKTQLKTLREWKEQGRVRYVGITHYRTDAFEELQRLMQNQPMDFVQFNYSVVTPEAEKQLLPLAADKGIAVIINRAFEDGRLFGRVKGKALPEWASEIGVSSWAQFFLKYVLAHSAVNCVIPATSDSGHLVDNMAAGVGPLPDAAMRKRMRATMSDL